VTVVSTRTAEGGRHATTASSFTSVSMDPKLVLVCLSAGSRALTGILATGRFAVHVLSEQQEHVARLFADPRRPAGSFGRVPLDESPVTLDCRTYDVHRAGDHWIVVGEVTALAVRRAAGPLVFHGGRLRALSGDPASREEALSA